MTGPQVQAVRRHVLLMRTLFLAARLKTSYGER
jgi:hypothetical protein